MCNETSKTRDIINAIETTCDQINRLDPLQHRVPYEILTGQLEDLCSLQGQILRPMVVLDTGPVSEFEFPIVKRTPPYDPEHATAADIPLGVYYDEGISAFWKSENGFRMSESFRDRWLARRTEFPQSAKASEQRRIAAQAIDPRDDALRTILTRATQAHNSLNKVESADRAVQLAMTQASEDLRSIIELCRRNLPVDSGNKALDA